MAIMGAFRARKNEAHQFDILPPQANSATAGRTRMPAPVDCTDAEFEVIRNEPSRRRYTVFNDNSETARKPTNLHTALKPAGTFGSLIMSFENALQRFSKTTFAGIAFLIFITIFWAVGSMTIAQHLPHSGLTPVVIEPLSISNVHISLHKSNGLQLLQVTAQIRNQSDTVRILPSVRLDLIPGLASNTPLTINPVVASLRPGESTGFTARYPYSGGKLPEARLTFEAKDVPAL
jgi:hypothetical protein